MCGSGGPSASPRVPCVAAVSAPASRRALLAEPGRAEVRRGEPDRCLHRTWCSRRRGHQGAGLAKLSGERRDLGCASSHSAGILRSAGTATRGRNAALPATARTMRTGRSDGGAGDAPIPFTPRASTRSATRAAFVPSAGSARSRVAASPSAGARAGRTRPWRAARAGGAGRRAAMRRQACRHAPRRMRSATSRPLRQAPSMRPGYAAASSETAKCRPEWSARSGAQGSSPSQGLAQVS